jgi:hypothetical protein
MEERMKEREEWIINLPGDLHSFVKEQKTGLDNVFLKGNYVFSRHPDQADFKVPLMKFAKNEVVQLLCCYNQALGMHIEEDTTPERTQNAHNTRAYLNLDGFLDDILKLSDDPDARVSPNTTRRIREAAYKIAYSLPKQKIPTNPVSVHLSPMHCQED